MAKKTREFRCPPKDQVRREMFLFFVQILSLFDDLDASIDGF